MSPRDLLGSTPWRLAVAFALAITLLTGGVFYAVYRISTQARIDQLQAVFADEAEKAAATDDAALQQALTLRLTRDFRRLNFVGLYDRSGRRLLGNIETMPDAPIDGRTRYVADFRPSAHDDPEPTLVVARRRPNGDVIVLGRSLSEASLLRAVLAQALSFAILPIAVGALLLGLLFARRTAARIGEIDRAIAGIVDGDLGRRLPSRTGLRELDGVVGSVNHMLDDIERLLGQLAAVGDNIAHDLRAPLMNMRALLERALAEAPRGEGRAAVQGALRQLDRAMTTIEALLRIAGIDRQSRVAGFRELELGALCAELQEFFAPLAEAKGVALTLAAERKMRRRGDPDLLREAIANLIDNALKFTPRGGAVRILARERAGRAEIIVSDNGRGVPAAESRDIFRRYVRARNGADLPGGGLGLAIAETIARLHGMELTVADNAPGARFTLAERDGP